MSLETIVSKMIAANEPESNIAKVIKHYNKKNSPLKATICPPGFADNEDGLGCVEKQVDESESAKKTMVKGFDEDIETDGRIEEEKSKNTLAGRYGSEQKIAIVNNKGEVVEKDKDNIDKKFDTQYLKGVTVSAKAPDSGSKKTTDSIETDIEEEVAKGINEKDLAFTDINPLINKDVGRYIKEDAWFQSFAKLSAEKNKIELKAKWTELNDNKTLSKEEKNTRFNDHRLELLEKDGSRSSVYNDRLKSYVNGVSNAYKKSDLKRREKEYGKEGSLTGAVVETLKTSFGTPKDIFNYFTNTDAKVPGQGFAQWGKLINAGNFKDLNAKKEKIEKLPQGSMVPNYGGKLSKKSNVMIGGRSTTREDALIDIDEKIEDLSKRTLKLISADQSFKKEINKFEQNQVLDKDGLTWTDFKRITGKGFAHVLTGIVSGGTSTGFLEAGGAYDEIASTLSSERLGISLNQFNKMSDEDKAKANLETIINNPKGVDEAFSVGLGNTILDRVGLKGIQKAIGNTSFKGLKKLIVRRNLADGYKNIIKNIGGSGAKLLTTQTKEAVTETGQKVVTRLGIATATDADIAVSLAKNPKEYAEEFLAAFISTGPTTKAMGAMNSALRRTIEVATKFRDPNANLRVVEIFEENTEKEFNNQIQELDAELDRGNITKEEYLEGVENVKKSTDKVLEEIEASKVILDNTKLRDLTLDEKKDVVPEIIKQNNAKKKIEILKQEKGDDDANYTGPKIDLDLDIEKQEKIISKATERILITRAKNFYKTAGKDFASYIEGQKDGFWGDKQILNPDTIEEAIKEIKKIAPEIIDPKNENHQEYLNLINGQNNGIKINDKTAIFVNENIEKGFKEDNNFLESALASNVVFHEGLHFLADGADVVQLQELETDITNKLKKSEDKDFIQAVEFAVKRKEQYEMDEAEYTPEQLTQEFFSALSDGLRVIDLKDISLEDGKILESIGKNISGLIKSTAPGFDFGKMTASNALQYLKSYNNFNSKNTTKSFKGFETKGTDNGVTNVVASKSNLKGLLDKYGSPKALIAKSLSNTSQGKPTQDLTQSEFGQEIAPIIEKLTQQKFDQIADDAKTDITRKDFKIDLISELATEIDRNYDPSKQDLDKFVTIRAFQRSNRTAKNLGIQSTSEFGGAGITTDIEGSEAQAVLSDEKGTDEITTKARIIDSLGLDEAKKSVDKNAERGIVKIENVLNNSNLSNVKKIPAIRKAIGGFFKKQYFDEVRNKLGKNTKTSNEFSKNLNDNFEALSDAVLNNTDFQKGNNIASDWNKYPPTKQEFIDYYEGKDISPSQPRSTKSDRKKSLIDAISKQVANDALIDYVKKNPLTAELFKKDQGVVLAQKRILPKAIYQTLSNIPGFKDGSYRPAEDVWKALGADTKFGYELSSEKGQKQMTLDLKKALTELKLPIDAFDTAAKIIRNPRYIDALNKKRDKIGREFGKKSKEYKAATKERSDAQIRLKEKLTKMLDDVKKSGNYVSLVNNGKGWKAADFSTLGNTPIEFDKSKNNGKVDSFNTKNEAMFNQTMGALHNIVYDDPKMLNLALSLTATGDGGSKLWFRLGGEVVAYSNSLKSNKNRAIEWEHAMQANNARMFLINSAVNKVPWNTVYPAVKRNYKVIGLDKAYDDILKAANRGNNMGEGWNVYTDSWLSRYFSPEVLLMGGIDPNTIIGLNGQSLADIYNIDAAGQPVIKPEILSDKSLDPKKIRIFDFDDTLAKSNSKVLYELPNGFTGSLNATEFAKRDQELKDKGAIFDFSEFTKVIDGKKGPLFEVAKKINAARGNEDLFVLTARPTESNKAIQEFLNIAGLDFKINNIVGLGDGTAKAKADWVKSKVDEGYNDFYFADDAIKNVKAVKQVLDDSGVKRKTQLALASKRLSEDFNKMLEKTKNVKSEAIYSDARAAKMGVKKGFQAFLPYSAEDFLGLIYPTLGKNEQGNKDLKWWKDNVMSPYNDGMTAFESSKQAAMIEWKEIKEQIKNTPTGLGKEAVRDFSNEDAIRVYLWNEKGVVPNDLSKKDIKALTDHIKNSPELRDFANQVNALNINGYPDPTKGWLAGTITTDLVNHVNTTTRSEMLVPWQNAIDAIYTDDNKNKLRATFGDKYIEALDDSLYRMKTGRNRPSGANRITNNWMNWVNDSVGTVMFFNQRSAVLQTISSINFMNWSDNNPAAAAKAFANQKQYWSDFSYLFNSDFLKQRRSGLKTDVNADELAQQAAGSTNKARAALSLLLKKGFLPTQMADSFAIASGGSTFYRNRVDSLIKSGMSKADAETQAFSDFRNSANESQQSSDPSRVSMEQASPLGRVILAFANTPIQYTRLTKRAAQDLVNGRGDWKTNVSRILYYGAVQNIIFTALQQAMFGMLFADDDDEFQNERKDKAAFNIANSTADTFLRGSGVAGAFVAMLKNMALEVKRQKDKKRPDYERVADKLFSVSPAIDTKFKKLQSAGRTFTYKQELKKMRDKGIAIDNPAYMAIAKVVSSFVNIPADRVIKKLNNIVEATNNKNAIWQRMALAMGWGEWELGITDRKTREAKEKNDSYKALEKSIKKVVKKRDKDLAKEEKKRLKAEKLKNKSPIKAVLRSGVLGQANKDGTIDVADGLSESKKKEVVAHEKRHKKEIDSGKLNYDKDFVYYGKNKYQRTEGKIIHDGVAKQEGDHSLPWEKHAHNI